jgi:excisionase family DNA binding protein
VEVAPVPGGLVLDDEAAVVLGLLARHARRAGPMPRGVVGLANLLVIEGEHAQVRLREGQRVHVQVDAALGALGSASNGDGLTSTEAANRLGVSAGRLRHLIRTGRLQAHKVGRDWRIGPSALAEYERRERVPSIPRAEGSARP